MTAVSQEKAKKAPLTQVERRMAFYAKLLKDDQLMLSEEDAEEWRRDLPAAIRGQHLLLDRGELPVAMSLANVRRLKTLAGQMDRLDRWTDWTDGQIGQMDRLDRCDP